MRARPWVDDYDGYVSAELHSRYNVVEETQFDGLTVFHFVRSETTR
jgi:hypothetical protein